MQLTSAALDAIVRACSADGRAARQTPRKVTQLAAGVYEIEHPRASSGNTTVIIGERQVFVVDTCFLPSAAREDIAQIRQWTDKPVSFVLNTHFHNDHNLGNRAYMDAFPALTIIAHVETKKRDGHVWAGFGEQGGERVRQPATDAGHRKDQSRQALTARRKAK